ncbi:MAG: hypothetical protein K6E50_04770 [Lachnospiraceae bacterium]|nr:hypothetical protein [Lachnospiraceae bacterium]
MDFQSLVDSMNSPCCVVSVEKRPDGGYGEIRLAAGNSRYAELIGVRMKPGVAGNGEAADGSMIAGLPYSEYFQKNINFEDVCFRSAVLKEVIHTYAHIYNVDVWFDIYVMPLEAEEGNICYCLYLSIPNDDADSILDAFHSASTASDVLKTCIKLHKASNLQEAMESVIAEIRQICKAEGCTVLLLNHEEEEFSILATDFIPGSRIKRVTEFEGYYDVANSWKGMLGTEGDCIIVRNEEDMERISRINNPWHRTLVEAGVTSVVLFPLRQGTEVQGFIWGRPLPAEEVEKLVAETA